MSAAQLARRARRVLAGRAPQATAPLARQTRAFDRAATLVAAFYVCNLFFAFRAAQRWLHYAGVEAIDPLWPIAWLPLLGIAPTVHLIMAVLLVSAVAAALLPQRRSARLVAFLGLLLYHALINSFGKISHPWHAWFLCAFVLVFLPDGPREAIARSRRARQHYLNAFASAQAFQLLFYTMSGTWKILGSVKQLALGEVHSFAPQALSMHIAHRLLQTDSESLLGTFFIEYPLVSWPSFLVTLYLQAFAVVAAFRPSLHRVWGLGLIGFHVVVLLTMAIPFGPPVLLLGLFFLCSPFAPERFDWRRALEDLPVFGAIARRLLPPVGAALAPARAGA